MTAIIIYLDVNSALLMAPLAHFPLETTSLYSLITQALSVLMGSINLISMSICTLSINVGPAIFRVQLAQDLKLQIALHVADIVVSNLMVLAHAITEQN